jgi:nucleotide-binding universal stress UspA family protein
MVAGTSLAIPATRMPWLDERDGGYETFSSRSIPMMRIQTILHPTDFSPSSGHAFQLACSLARDHGARLMVLHVVDRPVAVYGGVMTAPPPPPPVEERKAAQEQLHQIRQTDLKLPIESRLEEGDPAMGILEVAKEYNCDLIVMGTHGRTGLSRLLMGSVSEKVLRSALCPVMTLKAGEA